MVQVCTRACGALIYRGFPGRGANAADMSLILVVDDAEDVRLALRQLLEGDGHHVIEASDGDELIPAVLTHWPDLIMLDLNMPKVPGFEALELLRAQPAGKDFPVIVVTAAGSPRDAQRGRELGAKEYIGKPWAEGEIEMRVKWTLQSSQKPKRNPPERIFVVDDEEHVRLALMTTLQDAGYDAEPINGGSEVVEAVIKMQPDLILMDLRMPDLDGIEAIRRLRNIPTAMKLPIIVVTAVPSREAVQAARSLGVTSFVVKPWHARDLEIRVRKALDDAAAIGRVSV